MRKISQDQLLELASLHKDKQGTVFFYSGGAHESASASFLCFDPSETLTVYPDHWSLELHDTGKLIKGEHSNPWDTLNKHIKNSVGSKRIEWAGYLSYEMGAFHDQDKILPYQPPTIPLAQFFKCRQVLTSGPILSKNKSSGCLPQVHPLSHTYIKLIDAIKEEIQKGDVYQVNLSHEIKLPFKGDPYHFFLDLVQDTPAPFAAYLKGKDFSLISSSPERLLKKTGALLEARPIKGTARRALHPEEDAKTAEALMNSSKNRAELLMITDLMRNDLGKISLPGSVTVKSLAKLESYAHIFHLISEIQSQGRQELSAVEILRSIFPGGSITGCPKLSAMESIFRHEKRARGIYTGSIGYFTAEGDFDFNIAIRTLLYQNQTLTFGLGGAIVADSDPKSEYEETLNKGALIFKHYSCLS